MEFPWRCNVDTIAMDLKASWEMPDEPFGNRRNNRRIDARSPRAAGRFSAAVRGTSSADAPLPIGKRSLTGKIDRLTDFDRLSATMALLPGYSEAFRFLGDVGV